MLNATPIIKGTLATATGAALLCCPAPSLGAGPVAVASAKAKDAPSAEAAEPSSEEPSSAEPSSAEPSSAEPGGATFTPEGYVEAYYAFNFNQPKNGITNFRGWDNRHNSITLANAAIGGSFQYQGVGARLVLQAGSTPDSYYLPEPRRPGANGAAATGPEVFKHVQEASIFYKGLITADIGIFLSPIGPEAMAVKDQWTWSRSNLFVGLPAYHTAARIAYDISEAVTVRAAVYNGWNSVVDNNDEKSFSGEFRYAPNRNITFNVMYFGGVERDPDAAEGRAWRHLLDSYLIVSPHERLQLMVNTDVGIEPNAFGVSGWASGAVQARMRAFDWLYIAAMGDVFYEQVAENAGGRAAPMFWPSEWMASGTIALDVRPTDDHLAVKVEYRHDHAAGDTFFRGEPPIDATGVAIANARYQNTLLLGATAWF